MVRTALATTLWVVIMTPSLCAQDAAVHWGDRVRVRVPCDTTAGAPCSATYTEGLVRSLTADTLVLQDGGESTAFHLQDLERLERWGAVASKSNRTGEGMLVGLGLGTFAGMFIGGVISPSPCPDGAAHGFYCGEDMRGLDALAGAVVGAAGGLFVGGIIGGALSVGGGGFRWEPIPLPSSRATSSRTPTRPVHVAIAVAF